MATESSAVITNAVLVSVRLAPVLIECLERARRSARTDGLRLPPELDVLEHQLRHLVGDVVVVEEPSTTWIPIVEASERLGLSDRYVRHMAKTGLLPARKVGRGWVVDVVAVADEVAARAEAAGSRSAGDVA